MKSLKPGSFVFSLAEQKYQKQVKTGRLPATQILLVTCRCVRASVAKAFMHPRRMYSDGNHADEGLAVLKQ